MVDNNTRSGGITRISLIFYSMKVCCVFSLESPYRGDSNNEAILISTQNVPFSI